MTGRWSMKYQYREHIVQVAAADKRQHRHHGTRDRRVHI